MSVAIPIFPSLILKSGSFLIDPLATPSARLWILMALMTMHPLGQLLASGFWGASSDRYGRKPVFLLSFLGSIVGFIMMGYGVFTANLPLLFISRFFTGCMQGNLSVAQAVVSDLATEETRPRFFGRLYAAVSLAYVVGPWGAGQWIHSGGLTPFAYASTFWVMALLLVIAFGFIHLMGETISVSRLDCESTSKPRQFHVVQTLKALIRCFGEPAMRIPFLVNFFVYFGIFSYFRFYTVHFVGNFDFSPQMLSLVVGYSGLFTMLSQFFLLKVLSRYLDSERLLAIGAVGLFVFMLSMSYMPYSWSFIYTLPFIGAAIGITLPLCSLVIAEQTSGLAQGKNLGVNHCLQVIAEILVGGVGGYIATLSSSLAISFGGLIAAFGGLVLFRRAYLKSQPNMSEDEAVD